MSRMPESDSTAVVEQESFRKYLPPLTLSTYGDRMESGDLRGVFCFDVPEALHQHYFLALISRGELPPLSLRQINAILESHLIGVRRLLERRGGYNFFPVIGLGFLPALAILYRHHIFGTWQKLAWQPHDDLTVPAGSRVFYSGL